MPSDTVMVPKGTALPPAPSTPSTDALPSSSRWELQGVTILQAEHTATCGFQSLRPQNQRPEAWNDWVHGPCRRPQWMKSYDYSYSC